MHGRRKATPGRVVKRRRRAAACLVEERDFIVGLDEPVYTRRQLDCDGEEALRAGRVAMRVDVQAPVEA